MIENYDLWPKAGSLHTSSFKLSLNTASNVEDHFQNMFIGGFPVLVSSGRVGIVLALLALELDRSNLIRVFPYASHCVIEAIGRVATPLAGDTAINQSTRLVNHQWGYVQENDATGTIIEDAVDSFYEKGSNLFLAGGNIEIWSLPKLIGSLGGGIIWCRDEALSITIRELRDSKKCGTHLRWILRKLSHRWPYLNNIWMGWESSGGPVPNWSLGEINFGLDNWQKIAEYRHQRLNLLKSFLPNWLSLTENRLPCVVPTIPSAQQAAKLDNLNIFPGFRHFEVIDGANRRLEKIYPIPVHQQVPIHVIEKAVQTLET